MRTKLRILLLHFLNLCIKKDKKKIVFIPHGGCFKDGYNIKNYTSDNALSLFHYIVTHYGNIYKYCIAIDYRDLKNINEFLRGYSDIDISFFPYFIDGSIELRSIRKLMLMNYLKVFFRATYFFTSEAISFPYKLKKQKVTYLGYYIPFKNDYDLDRVNFKKDKGASTFYDYCITTSLLSSQIISHAYNIPLYKFHALGFSRNDELLKNRRIDEFNHCLERCLEYPINKVILYTPTHRDYEESIHNNIRDILGFQVKGNKLTEILRRYGAVIVCKIHSKQNLEALKAELPVGVLLYHANKNYGLCELMQYSDCLITDYTSVYFDYLLLDKPVIFNFYDFEKYKEFRGFSFDPLNGIIAGEVFTDEKSFCEKLELVLSGEDKWKQKRQWVRELVHKYVDDDSSQRIYDFIFKLPR